MTAEALPQERAVRLWLDGKFCHVFYCTPRDLPDLAAGFLLSHGLLEPGWLPALQVSEEEPWTVRAEKKGAPRPAPAAGPFRWPIPLAQVLRLASDTMENTPLRRDWGGVHAAAIGWEDGELIREDVARHNAVDKVLGAGIIKGVDLGSAVLFTTGRLSHEMLVKAAAAGIPVAATIKYPTDLGVALAARKGMCVVGRVLSPEPVVYTGHWRLGLPEPRQ